MGPGVRMSPTPLGCSLAWWEGIAAGMPTPRVTKYAK